jgi:serine/threonine kinase 16
MLRLFKDVCEAVKYLHTYKTRGSARTMYSANQGISTEDEHSQDREALLRNQQDQPSGEQIQMGERGEIVPWAHRDIKPG